MRLNAIGQLHIERDCLQTPEKYKTQKIKNKKSQTKIPQNRFYSATLISKKNILLFKSSFNVVALLVGNYRSRCRVMRARYE